MLTEEQLAHFETFGFILFRQLFSAAEMAAFTEQANELWQEDLATRSEETAHQHIAPFIERRPLLAGLPEDDRIYNPVQQLLGPGFTWGGSEGNKGSFNETNDHQWHSDRAGQIDLQYRRIKIMIYLQAMQRDNGALRLIPGSHKPEFHRQLFVLQSQHQGSSLAAFGVPGPDLPCFPVEVEPGDVVLFDHYLYHAVYGKQNGRSYIAVKFAARPESEVHYEALRAHHQDASHLHENFRHSNRPRIRGMVDGLLKWEAQLALEKEE